MSVNIVIPVKARQHAKRRLAPALKPDDRGQVARFLCRRTLDFFSSAFAHVQVSVVTASREMAETAASYGVDVIPERTADGLSAAAQLAAGWSLARGFDTQLVIPADIAELSAEEIEHILACATPTPSVTVCPSVDGRTHALMTTPPNAIPFAFGFASSWRHSLLARQRHISCQVLQLPKLSRDIDTPADLAQFNQRRRAQSTQAVRARG